MIRKICLLLAAAEVLATAACGEVIVSDHFDYPDGPLVNVSNGAWRTHSGTEGQVLVADGQILLSQKKSEDVSTVFPGGPVGTDHAPALYASFLVKFTALPSGTNGAYFAHFKDGAATTGIRCRVFATTNGAPAGRLRLGISAAANTASSECLSNLTLGVGYRVVCRMSLFDNVSTLWIDPQSESDRCVSSTDEAAPAKPAAAFAFRESLASGAGMGELTVDELVIATSFNELTPAPPSSLSLSICRDGAEGVQVSWTARSEHTYSIWAADSLETGFGVIASQLWFGNGIGSFTDQCGTPLRLYQVSEE